MTFSATDKRRCVQREIAQRQRVYPRLVAAGKMTQQQADRELRLMQEIFADYERQETAATLFPAFEGGGK